MSNKKNVTKKDYFNALREVVENMDAVGAYSADEVLEFIDKQVAQLDAKSEKAKAKAVEKKAEGDELRAKVLAAVTEEFQSAEAITAAVADPEVSKAKVVARLTQLVKNGDVVKEEAKTEAGKRMTYKLA